MDEAQRRHKEDGEDEKTEKKKRVSVEARGTCGIPRSPFRPPVWRLENSFAESRSAGSGCYGTTGRRQLKGTADV
ncbi:hypothetical protein K0M31_006976 [Melipona bicolor]|uniref:Uncharacterized protein n=1 Tax=Melipona bicolor TaxID=60889 RepID=A0AA40FS23_9HYME|nr:hypothetical protein K0M31_006976 [Melipona bicolor]